MLPVMPRAMVRQQPASTRATGVITNRSARLRETAFISTPSANYAVRIQIIG